MPSFWRLTPPAEDDYRAVFVNGEVRATHALPTVGCRTCARLRRSRRVLPIDCPDAWRRRSEVVLPPRREYRTTNAQFAELSARLSPALDSLPADMGPLQPGDSFQPLLLRLASTPEVDVLWPGVGHILVSQRVRVALEAAGVTGAMFARIAYDRVGTRSASHELRPRGEPEDVLKRIPERNDTSGLPTYWHVTVTQESGLPPGVDPSSVCPECERALVPVAESARRILFVPSMWRGADVCWLATTLHVVVTDRVRATLERIGATNIHFQSAEDEVRPRHRSGVSK